MLYAFYRIGFFLAKIVPLKVSYFIATLIARIFFIFSKNDKEALCANLRVVLGDGADERLIEKLIFDVFKNFAKYLVDFFRFPKFTKEYISKNIEIEGQANLDECLREGKGVIVLSIHLGNWELGGAIVGALKYPMTAIVLEQKDKRINDLFIGQRAINNLRSIPLGPQVKECFRALRSNEILAIVGDKDYTASGILVDFFGRKAIMPKGPAVFSVKTGSPIVCSFMVRKKDDTFKLCFEKAIRHVSSGDEGRDTRMIMDQYLKIFEKHICENPGQWYAFKKIWNQDQKTQ